MTLKPFQTSIFMSFHAQSQNKLNSTLLNSSVTQKIIVAMNIKQEKKNFHWQNFTFIAASTLKMHKTGPRQEEHESKQTKTPKCTEKSFRFRLCNCVMKELWDEKQNILWMYVRAGVGGGGLR